MLKQKCIKCGNTTGVIAGIQKDGTNPNAVPEPGTIGAAPQKWKTFETNAQKEKGITHEQSMAEIDKFLATGRTTEGEKEGAEAAEIEETDNASKSTQGIQAMMERAGIAKKGEKMFSSHVVNKNGVDASKLGSAGTGKTTTTTTEITETTFHIDGPTKAGPIAADKVNFKDDGNKTANDYLNQFKEKEAAKFKPQKDGKYR